MHQHYSSGMRAMLLIVSLLIFPTVQAGIPNKQELQKQLQSAEKRWKRAAVHNYSYIAGRLCKMCDLPAHVVVKKDQCVKVLTLAEPAKELPCNGYTVPEVFSRLHMLIDDNSVTSLQVAFDEELGYPSRFVLQTIVPHEKEQGDIGEFRRLD